MDATVKKNRVARATQFLGFVHRREVWKHNTHHRRILANKQMYILTSVLSCVSEQNNCSCVVNTTRRKSDPILSVDSYSRSPIQSAM